MEKDEVEVKLSKDDIQAIHEFLNFTKKVSKGWRSYVFVGRSLGVLIALYLLLHDFWGAIASFIHSFFFGNH